MTAADKLREWECPHSLKTLLDHAIEELKVIPEEDMDETVQYISSLLDLPAINAARIACYATIGIKAIHDKLLSLPEKTEEP